MTTSNPAFTNATFAGYDQVYGGAPSTTMTVQGTVGKTFALLAILSATALWSWDAAASGALAPAVMPGAAIAGLILAMITIFKQNWAAWTAPLYAAAEGVFLGALSNYFDQRFYPGIALQAVGLTVGTLAVMLTVYGTGLIRVTDKLRAGIVAATGAIFLVYMVTFLLGLFGVQIPYIHGAGPIGIGFSLFVVGLAAFNLLLDFDFIERGQQMGAPKSMEWYGAFGLVVTLIWLYLEILRLLSKLQSRD